MNLLRKITILALMLLAGQASAQEYNQVQLNQSALTFGYRQMGVPMEGKFSKFSAQISFDPAKLASAQAHIDVNLASIDTGSSDADESVAGKLWFNTKLYPLVSFVSTGVKALGGNRYQATGKLSIKGRTLDITAPVTFQADGNRGSFDGSFNIKRLDTVAADVQIKFHLVVLAAPAAAPPSLTQPKRKKP